MLAKALAIVSNSPLRVLVQLLRLGPAVLLSLFVVTVFFTVVYQKYPGQIIFTDGSITIPFVAMFVLCGLTLYAKRGVLRHGTPEQRTYVWKSAGQTLIDWAPFPILLFVYENLKGRIQMVTDRDYTVYFMQIEEWLYGAQPTLVFQDYIHPILTDMLAICYASYFIVPFLSTLFLYLQKRMTDFHVAVTSIIVCFYLGYIGYITIPGVIPKFFLREVYEVPLRGLFLHQFMDRMYEKANAAEIWGAFPSLHIAGSTVGLILAFHFKGLVGKGRGLFWITLPVVLGLWVSTVYLRYHWTIDIFAGWILAWISFALGKRLVAFWEGVDRRLSEYPS